MRDGDRRRLNKGRPRSDVRVRFLKCIVEKDGHWICNLVPSKRGYVYITEGKKRILTNRLSWEIYHGEIPEGKHVLHSCDIPACVHPDHLFLGTHADNMADRNKKGRQAKGDKIGTSVLDETLVREIRSYPSSVSNRTLARKYKVSHMTIGDVRRRKSWTHVPD